MIGRGGVFLRCFMGIEPLRWILTMDSLSQAIRQAYDSCLVLTCWWRVFPINCHKHIRFVELALYYRDFERKEVSNEDHHFSIEIFGAAALNRGNGVDAPLWRHCHTMRVENGRISPMRASQENRWSRSDLRGFFSGGTSDFFLRFPPFLVCAKLYLFGKRVGDPFKENFWQVFFETITSLSSLLIGHMKMDESMLKTLQNSHWTINHRMVNMEWLLAFIGQLG